ncbi:Rieske 2Fe-2S domain-containing protein [Streptomyces sp. ALI-76-A]|uniref:Rieske 2Fe-2S domain-containing protein n=1 Tax=Streptomyces sp. ALI-76-A TaxID=3025736 RepID=UPI00256EF939|nr:Rieske 2Fe-2S domain-containing protein [Streptomyces sp. ALI-76-A]MDL5199306.1 Rieske 2Fe-2S domain-containing protein [Streptomyces sp. ALI-76-A]
MSTTPRRRRLRQNRVLWLLDRLERDPRADPMIETLRGAVRSLPLGRVRDVLHGRWLGHPVHPLMVQVPIGSWLSAAVLDLRPGRNREAGVLVGVGLAAAAPAALTGAVDWAELHRQQMRVGLVHALANTTAVGLYAASLACRVTGRSAAGRTYGYLGLTAVGVGGMLGGHLAYRQASGANHAEEVPHVVSEGWHRIGSVDEFPAGRPVRRSVDDVPVLVVRESGGTVHALADRCSHLAGPLSEGTVSDGCVRCPWHGSVFRLSDGWNVRGPATAPQPAFDTRIVDGHVEVRLRADDDEDRARSGGEADLERSATGADRAHGYSN